MFYLRCWAEALYTVIMSCLELVYMYIRAWGMYSLERCALRCPPEGIQGTGPESELGIITKDKVPWETPIKLALT